MLDSLQPVESPEFYFGQKGLIRRIFSRIGAERPQSIAVIGSRKSGKTSLLNYLCDYSVQEKYLGAGAGEFYSFLKITGKDYETGGVHDFISQALSRVVKTPIAPDEHYSFMQRYVENEHRQGRKLIVLFDDFHHITGNSTFPLEFFSFLRSLANNYNVAYITTSFLELQKLCVVKDIEDSPFFNIFTNLSIGLLTPEAARRLFRSLTAGGEEADRIVDWLGGSPYMIKLAAAELIRRGLTTHLGSLNPAGVLDDVLSSYFEKIVSILNADAVKPLKALIKDKNPDEKEIHHLRPIIKHGFLRESDDGRLSFFAPSFRSFLRKSLSFKMLKGYQAYG